MARAMWKGAIQFGLVTIPIKLYLATESKGISFNMLHKEDLSRIQMKVWCPVEDEAISRGDTVKGYEYSPGEYVVITDEDLEKVPLKTVRSIEIEQFTKAERDDNAVRFVKSAYYVEPDKIGRKAFYLLKSVLEDEGLTAICKVVIKDREALAALDPFAETLLLTTLHWPDEIRSTEGARPAGRGVRLQAGRADDGQAARVGDDRRVRPGQYKDEYREALEKIIEAKVEGKRDRRDRGARGDRQADRPDGGPRGVGLGRQGRPRVRCREARLRGRGPREEGGRASPPPPGRGRRRPTTKRRPSRPLGSASPP